MKTKTLGLAMLAGLLLALASMTPAHGQPPTKLPAAPAPMDPGPVVVTPKTTDIMLLLADTHFYKQDGKKKAGFDVQLVKAPYEWQSLAHEDVFGKAWIKETLEAAEKEANRPSDRSIKLTKITHVRFTLSEAGDRFDSVLVYVEGTKPKSGGMGTEPLATGGDSAAVTLTLSEVTWTPAFSNERAKEWRENFHAKLGRPDDGTTWRHALATVESKLKIVKKPAD